MALYVNNEQMGKRLYEAYKTLCKKDEIRGENGNTLEDENGNLHMRSENGTAYYQPFFLADACIKPIEQIEEVLDKAWACLSEVAIN